MSDIDNKNFVEFKNKKENSIELKESKNHEEKKLKEKYFESFITKENKNKNKIYCKRCNTIIFKNNVGTLETKIELNIPNSKGELVQYNNFWILTDMYSFENISFTRSPGIKDVYKYLTCANCENYAIGIVLNENQKIHYISIENVKNE
jgi:hypothetical protein